MLLSFAILFILAVDLLNIFNALADLVFKSCIFYVLSFSLMFVHSWASFRYLFYFTLLNGFFLSSSNSLNYSMKLYD